MSRYQALIKAASAVTAQAAEAIMEIYARADHQVESKADDSPLTAADLASHRVLVEGLGALEPGVNVLSEESDPETQQRRHDWSELWVVDPLDGTREFVSRNGQFAICVALIVNGEAVAGIVHRPVGNELYRAARGSGAESIIDGVSRQLRVSQPAIDPPRVVVSRSHRNAETESYLQGLGAHTAISAGSAIKFAKIAAGEADLYPRLGFGGYEWDVAAGQVLIEEAGGRLLSLNGKVPRYNKPDSLKAGSFMAFGQEQPRWMALLK